jgi:hypothetical protein
MQQLAVAAYIMLKVKQNWVKVLRMRLWQGKTEKNARGAVTHFQLTFTLFVALSIIHTHILRTFA